MRAALLTVFDADLQLTNIPDPTPISGQILVRISASGVNPLDTKIRRGQAAHAATVLPAVLGLDLAGVVAELGPDVTGFSVGDEVYGMTGGSVVIRVRSQSSPPSMPDCWRSNRLPCRCVIAPQCR